jgi:hypothetical protein
MMRRWRVVLMAVLLALSSAARGEVRAAPAGSPNALGFARGLRCTSDPQAASSVPGWNILSGSPALRCGDSFPARWRSGSAPRVLIGNGPYGASVLERSIPLQAAAASQHRRFILSASFGAFGRGAARAVLTGSFLGSSGRRLGAAVVLRGPPAIGRELPVRFQGRSVAGNIPPGAVEMELRLALAGRTSHARSYVTALRLETIPALSFPPPRPPPARVPRFDHVFLIMMENTDYGQVIGDTKNAPYINSLAARGTLLANFQAVYHPSDQNYLAIAGGDTFVRGAVYFPKIHVAAKNLGDLLEAAGESWKEYLEGMGTPCNLTTRYDRNFEPDDAPFINFNDIRRDAGRCRAHLVDLTAWFGDLKSAATTPAFAWLAADDYDDGEMPGNGSPKSLRVQDAWLQRTLDPLFASPAWREQRSLLILTWDESSTLANNHIATIVVGSRGTVRSGGVSARRYDDYSTARTIEAALGLPSLTSNDAYAPAFDDAFVRDRATRPTSVRRSSRRSGTRAAPRAT